MIDLMLGDDEPDELVEITLNLRVRYSVVYQDGKEKRYCEELALERVPILSTSDEEIKRLLGLVRGEINEGLFRARPVSTRPLPSRSPQDQGTLLLHKSL